MPAVFIFIVLAVITVIAIGAVLLTSGLIIKNTLPNIIGPAEKTPEIAVIHIEGTMMADRSSGSSNSACSSDIVRELIKATEDDNVRAIVLRVNSPGGTPVAAEEILSQVDKTRKKKPVVVSMGDIATSAGYYVSSSADRIIANPDTFTGSIGVIWVFKNRTQYYNEEGINFYIAKSGNYKDAGADYRGLSEIEKEYAQTIINETYDRFISTVARGRNMTVEEVEAIADGRVYTGSKAKELGLVDELGGLYDAVEVAAKLGNAGNKIMVVHMNEPPLTGATE